MTKQFRKDGSSNWEDIHERTYKNWINFRITSTSSGKVLEDLYTSWRESSVLESV
jgi:hypothetical protein